MKKRFYAFMTLLLLVVGSMASWAGLSKAVASPLNANGGQSFDNTAVSVSFPMDDASNPGSYTTTLAEALNLVTVNTGDLTLDGTAVITQPDGVNTTIKGLKLKPAGATKQVEWQLRPSAGLVFTPTKISAYVNRHGTDAENCITISAKQGDGAAIQLAKCTAWRQGKSTSNKAYDATAVHYVEVVLTAAQQQQLAGSDILTVVGAIGVGSTKHITYAAVTIEGTVSGTMISVPKYAVTLQSAPSEGGMVSAYPASAEYLENDEVTMTAEENFGYNFVNWTDKEGNIVSAEPVFKHIVTKEEALTANFVKVNTYELAMSVEGGANPYMVTLSPEPNVVDGKNMYEEGTKVTISAASNPIVKFTNWSNGETAADMPVIMNGDKAFTASYAAVDYIVGWDFVNKGNDGRAADFAAAENDAVSLVMRMEDGTTSGWLDKSQVNGGYEGRPGAVCWRTGSANGDVGHWYWQTAFNASAFTDIKVQTAMTYNYNAYPKYDVQYSLDGETWTTIGSINIPGAKNWTDATFALPADANNQAKVYLRWIADKTSVVAGTASPNDGICLGATYITGTAKLVDDGTAPVLVSSVPANGATSASANGKVVLTFDEKVKLTATAKATIAGVEVTPTVSGKTVICEYKGLPYSTDIEFTLCSGSVADLTDNVVADAISIKFQTKVKPAVTKALYDFIVGVDGTITQALDKANERGANATERFRIFIPNGKYVFESKGEKVGGDGITYPDPRSYVRSPYISFIGQSMEGVEITNVTPAATWDNGFGTACPLEGIGNGDVLIIESQGHDSYFQNLTIKTSMGDAHGRDIALQDRSNRTIMKDARLWGYQDTYVSNSNNGKYYFEGGVIRGRTDYLCGKGDVFYNEVTLQQVGTGGYVAVPSNPKKYGYVFYNCYIKKETKDVSFYLGRPWGKGTPTACFINTKMDVNALGNGWADMSGGWPKRFAEYNSTLASGTTIDLSSRRTSWTDAEGVAHSNDPILTLDDVNEMSLQNVMGQDDDWDPTQYTEQASAPTGVMLNSDNNIITWNNNDYVLCWVVFKNGNFFKATTEPTAEVDDATATWTVRAANEMGGLGEATTATVVTAISGVDADAKNANAPAYNVAGQRVQGNAKGIIIKNGVKSVK